MVETQNFASLPLTVTTSGSYTVTQSLSGCTSSASAAVAAAPGSGLTLTPTITNVSCHGGSNSSISVVASGGSGSYTYSWAPCGGSTNSITGKTAGTYTVTVTNGECHATGVYTITQPSTALAVSGTVTNVTCNGGNNGSITTTVTGGTPSYSYLWSPGGATTSGISGKAAGTYGVTVTDGHGCTASGSYTITQAGAISCSISVTPSTSVYTAGVPTNFYLGYGPQSATCNASCSAGSGCTYSWSGSSGTSCLNHNNINNPVYTCSSAGNYIYTCTVTTSTGCTTTQHVSICVVDCQDHSHSGHVLVCHGSGCTPTTVSCTSSDVPTYITPSYCPSNHLGAVGSECSETGGREAGEEYGPVINELTVNAYPNPFNSELNVKIQSNLTDNVDVTVYDVTGRTMEAKKDQSAESIITVGQNLTAGVYFIEVNQGGVVRKVKVVKY